jgi:hypothetical protein
LVGGQTIRRSKYERIQDSRYQNNEVKGWKNRECEMHSKSNYRSGTLQKYLYRYGQAKADLAIVEDDIAKWVVKHNKESANDKYGVEIHWTDVHIESREVTEWEEVK